MTIPWTYLTIDGVQPLDRTARGIKVEMSLIEIGGEIVRLANGKRRSLRRIQFDLYKITVTGVADRKPAIDHLRRGSVVEIGCPAHIDLPGDVADADLPRPAVPGSIVRFGEVAGQPVRLAHGAPGVQWTAFRPLLTIMIDDLQFTEDEMNAEVSWSFTGEEEGAD